MDQKQVIPVEGETSGFIEVFTAILPFILLAIIVVIVIAIIYIYKIIKRYIHNSKVAEERLKMDKEDIKKINQRLDRIEKILNDVE